MAVDLPGLPEIQAWAAKLGIDVSDTVTKAQLLMQTNPAAVRAGGADLSTVANGAQAGQQDLRRTGTDVLTNWRGQAADAFGPHHAELVGHVGDTANAANGLSEFLHGIATMFEQGQRTVTSATGVTVTALRMQR